MDVRRWIRFHFSTFIEFASLITMCLADSYILANVLCVLIFFPWRRKGRLVIWLPATKPQILKMDLFTYLEEYIVSGLDIETFDNEPRQ